MSSIASVWLAAVASLKAKWADKYILGCRTLPDSFYKLQPTDIP